MPITTSAQFSTQYDWAALVGRILLALIFIMSGFNKISGFEGLAGSIASKGLPMPQALAAATILVELGGGMLLVVGWKARWAALAIAGFCVLSAFIFHNYWTFPPEQRMNQFNNFWKNIAIAGGMLMVLAFGPGRYAVDRN